MVISYNGSMRQKQHLGVSTVQGCGDNTGIPSSKLHRRGSGLNTVHVQDGQKLPMYKKQFPNPDAMVDC